ncbi:hypothetical protein [Paracoccus marcusii]|uniref:hypothetical protein n=1 Tax=Paracoccus marcusii TaxID=59779 RepID=UPI002493BD12|nr:hypothetical protein [Paracoccus marcusii]
MLRLATILALMIAGPAAGQSDGDVVWNTGRLPDGPGHAAEIAYEGRRLSYVCRPGDEGRLVIDGMGQTDDPIVVLVDGQRIAVPSDMTNGVHSIAADPGSQLLSALTGGRQVTLLAGPVTLSLPLEGSRRAIGRAMEACDLRP